MYGLTTEEEKLFRSLNSPTKIQDFLNSLSMRFDSRDPIVRSPRSVLKKNKASCMEGALFAAAVLLYHGKTPLLMDLRVAVRSGDVDHVVALFKDGNHYGALSKTNHGVLRYREPIYRTVRELALSFFHEYFTYDGKKTLRSYSAPFNVKKGFGTSWITSMEDLYEIACELDSSPHFDILSQLQKKGLRPADPLEVAMGKLTEKKKL